MIKPLLANVHSFNVSNVKVTPKQVASQGHAISVSGCLYALTIVGSAARPSATILKKIATFPTFVISQRIRPATDKKPHTTSNLVNFHSAFLLVKEPIKVKRGKKPVLKVINDSKPTPCFIWAAKAIIGAIDHNKKETLFGLTFPLIVSHKYAKAPAVPMRVPMITKF